MKQVFSTLVKAAFIAASVIAASATLTAPAQAKITFAKWAAEGGKSCAAHRLSPAMRFRGPALRCIPAKTDAEPRLRTEEGGESQRGHAVPPPNGRLAFA